MDTATTYALSPAPQPLATPGEYLLPPEFYLRSPDAPPPFSVHDGDREALSALIAAYSFTSTAADLMRFTSVLYRTIQGYLVKSSRYSANYAAVFSDIFVHLSLARSLLSSPRDQAQACTILYSLETALVVIAEREGLTKSSSSMFDGRMPIQPIINDQEDDPHGRI